MGEDYLSQPINIGSGDDNSSHSTRQQKPTITIFGNPYLESINPRILQQPQPEFIFPEGASKHRGRFEFAFSEIGSAVIIGAGLGGSVGLYNGIVATNLSKQTGKLRRTQLLNHVMKQGSATANTLGSITVIYSAFGVLLQYMRGKDDGTNTILAGVATGLCYKSTAGLKRCGIGGCIGLAASSLYCTYNYFTTLNEKNKYHGLL